MTKHLRLIMLSLLAMICLGGYSAVGDTYKLVTSVAELNDGDVIVIGDSENGHAMGPVNSTSSNNRLGKKVDIVDGVLKFTDGVAELTLKACADNKWKFHSNEGYLYAAGANKDKQNYLRSDEAITGEQSIATIAFEGNNAIITFGGKAKSKIIKHNYSKNKNGVTSLFSCYSSGQKDIQIYKKQIKDNRQDAGIHFAKDSYTADITKGTFNGAELVTPKDLEVVYEITPKTEGVSIAEDGTVTYPAVEATYTVTAKFAGNDTYKPATATYTLNVVDPNAVVFDATVDKGAYSSGGQYEKLVKADQYTTTLYGNNAAFNATGKAYRFYASSHMKISVTKGIITKIKLEGNNSQENPLDKFELLTTAGKITKSTTAEVIWEGSADEVIFNNKAGKQIRISKITVTVKPHYTLDETVDNVIEAKENAYVTLKRTFYHDNAWNTLCLPFDVDANKVATAFAGAEIREIDPNKCTANTIQFVPATEIKAGVPYIIKWNENVAEAKPFEETFEGVMLVAEPKPVTIHNNDIKFTGFYNKTTADNLGESVAAIGAENKLFKVTSGEMKGFRAAFVLNSNAQPSAIKLVIDGTATGIEDLVIDGVKANGRVYNLNGQYVGNSLNGLQPGLYIQNGKKIVVK